MTDFIAALPMYDWPETRAEVDAQWGAIRDRLRAAGVPAPVRLVRRNADMPPVPGGIRDAAGAVIGPDPATLPPDALDLPTLWRHPALLFGQTCWGPIETTGLGEHVQLVGQPDYSDVEGGEGEFYRSAILMRREISPPSGLPAISPSRAEITRGEAGDWPISPLEGEMAGRPEGGDCSVGFDTPAPALLAGPSHTGEGEAASIPLDLLRGRRLAYNEPHSMSGILALTRDLEAAGEGIAIFSKHIETGGHRASIRAVAEGRADVCAIDCRSWAMAKRYEPAAQALEVVGWTARRKGLPYVSARGLGRFHGAIGRALTRMVPEAADGR